MMSGAMPRWDAHDYHRHSGAQQSWGRELIAKLDLSGDEHVLDVGCGDGKLTAEFIEYLPRGAVVGIDSSPEMIGFAREAFPPERCPRLRFELMDARDLRFREEFDVVFSNATLHWIVDHRRVLAGIAAALVPGGRVLLQMGGRGNASAVVEAMHATIAGADWRAYFNGFAFPYGFHGPEEYRAWLEAAGLRPLGVELLEKDMAQAGREGLAGWMRTTWLPYLERVPATRREALIDAVIAHYVARHPPDASGQIHVAMARLEVEAERPEPTAHVTPS
jgi:trans-aconitate 2-methyltransferase